MSSPTERAPATGAQARDLRRSAVSGVVFAVLGVLPVLPLAGSLAGIAIGVTVRRRAGERRARRTATVAVVLGWAGLALDGAVLAFYLVR